MNLPISISCPNCGVKLKIKDEAQLGRRIKCPQCSERFKADIPPDADDEQWDLDDELPPASRSKRSKSKEPAEDSSKKPKRSKKSTRASSSANSTIVIAGGAATAFLIVCGVVIWVAMGRTGPIAGDAKEESVANSASTGQKVPVDEYTAVIKKAPAGERPFLLGAKPFLHAVAKRDYTAAYKSLSTHAIASIHPEQFVAPREENHAAQPLIKEIYEDQFAEWMQKMESARGIPLKVSDFYVQSADAKILSGLGDPMETMFAIGAMPKEIPVEIRKASIRSRIDCKYSDAQVTEIAKLMNITEEQVRSGRIHSDEPDEDSDETPYFNLKFVLVEEGGELKVAYFEFMPPSMFD